MLRQWRGAVTIACLAAGLVAPLVAAGSASAASPINLRKVSFANRSVPGSTCFSTKAIKLHKGHGHGGRHLVADLGPVRYGDITGDKRVEAFVDIECSTGGGTAASQAKETWAVFTARGGHVRSVGVISGRHQWRAVHSELLSPPRVSHRVATVTEHVYGPSDADCCPSLSGTTRWVVSHGKLKVRSTSIGGDLLIRATSMGRAKLGMTLSQLRHTYKNVDAYGKTGSCSNFVSFGRQYDQENGQYDRMFAYLRKGRIFRIDPGSSNAVTDRGIGKYSSPADVRRAYPHRVHNASVQGMPFLRVVLKSASFLMGIDKESYGTFVDYAPVLYSGHATTAPHC